MSGGRFLVSLKDVMCSENVIKVKDLVKRGFNITEDIKFTHNVSEELQNLSSSVGMLLDGKDICLSEDSRQVSDNIAGYIVHQVQSLCEDCCDDQIHQDNNESCKKYHKTLSRGGFKKPSNWLSDFVTNGLAHLDAASELNHQEV